MRRLLTYLPRLWANWLTLLGSAVTTVTALAIVILLVIELSSTGANAYTVSFIIVALPFLFVFGLLMLPIGLWLDRRKRARSGEGPTDPVEAAFDTAFKATIENRRALRRIVFLGIVTLANVLIFAVAGQKAVTHMDSPEFCGKTCHTVMQPEWEAYNRSPHARVACVDCHIGSGATWAAKAKINGLHQLWALMNDSYARPIPWPVEQLRPSRDTCEECHWSDTFAGDRFKVFPHYQPDRNNTPTFNGLMLYVGGRVARSERHEGIHWHASRKDTVRYEYLDRQRTRIGKITVLREGEVARVYEAPKGSPAPLGEREMDCIDCHNRPTHEYDLGARQALDRALWEGLLDPKLPYIVEVGRGLLVEEGISREGTRAWFRGALEAAYAKKTDVTATPAQLDQAAAGLSTVWLENNYPAMGVTWLSYRSQLGHEGEKGEVLGCYRCHDGERVARLADGKEKTLEQDCELCHEQVAVEEDPMKFGDGIKSLLPGSPERYESAEPETAAESEGAAGSEEDAEE